MITPSDLLPLLAESGQPDPLFRAIEAATQEVVGHQLFTLLYVDGNEIARCHSSRPKEYPVAGRKPKPDSPWADHVLRDGQPWLGIGPDAIRWAFFDHELILSMGLRTVINCPVVYNGTTIGTMNLLAPEGAYDQGSVDRLRPFAPLLIPAFLSVRTPKT